MPAAIGPRFVLEAGFLILLAVVAGLAELRPALIVLVMTVGWLLVSLIEYFAWRQSVGLATAERYAVAEGPAPEPIHEEIVEEPPPPPPPVTPPPAPPETEIPEPDVPPPPPPEPDAPPQAEEETMVATPDAEPGEAEEVIDFRPEREIDHRLEPLKPRPSRRWIIFGPRVRGEDDREEER